MSEKEFTNVYGRDKRLDWSNCMAEGRKYNIFSGKRYSNGNEYIDYSEHEVDMREIWKDIEFEKKLKEIEDGKTYDFIEDCGDDVNTYITVW